MSSVSATDLKNVLNASETATQLEYVLDLTIDILNLYTRLNIPGLSGSAGSKTVTLSSSQRGAVFLIARVVYASYFRNAGNMQSGSMGSASVSVSDLMSNSEIMGLINQISRQMCGMGFRRS